MFRDQKMDSMPIRILKCESFEFKFEDKKKELYV